MTTRLTWAEYAARQFEPRPRRYPTPGALAAALDPATRRSPALDLLDRALVTLMDPAGGYDALEVSLPPQEGKPVITTATILMGDGTRKPLGEVRAGEWVISHTGRPRQVTAVHDQGPLPIVRITTHGGRVIRAAADHPFMTPEGWTEAGKLTAGDTLAILTKPQITSTTRLTAQAARLLGYFAGDGNTTAGDGNLNAAITVADEIECADIMGCVAALGFTATVKNQRVLVSGGVRPWLREHGLAGCTSWSKRVPAAVLTSPPEIVAEFLGAYFACDGTVSRRGSARPDCRLEFYSVAVDLLRDVQHLLLRLSIASTLRPKNSTYAGKPYVSWRLMIRRQDDAAKFRRAVPLHSVKTGTLGAWDLHRTEFDAGYQADPVSAVAWEAPAECRCLTVAVDHTFTAEDAVVHNSQRVSRRFAAWLLDHDPGLRVAVVSYEQELAVRWGRDVKGDVMAHHCPGGVSCDDRRCGGLHVPIRRDSTAAGRWETTHGGSMYCVGIGGGLTGRPVDCLHGDTAILTPAGHVRIRDIHRAARKPRVLSYNHGTGRAEWRPVISSREIPAREVVEIITASGRRIVCTPDHRISTIDGYKPAAALQPGDRLTTVLPVRNPGSDAHLRLRQENPPWPGTGVLQPGLPRSGAARGWPPMQTVRPADRLQGPRPPVLLTGMPGSGQAAEAHQPVPALRARVHATEQPHGLLLAAMCEQGTLAADDRRRQRTFQGRHQLRRVVPPDAPADPRTGPGMPGLPPAGPHRTPCEPRPPGLPGNQPDPALRNLPCGTPQVENDTVAMVRELRGKRDTVYDIQVAVNSNFFAGQVLVHNCLIVDDPVKGRAEAESQRLRDTAWDWWENVALPRLAPGARVCLIMTRWHTDDLAGRIAARPGPLRWRRLVIPAIAADGDPLGRAPGEELVSVRGRAPGYFHHLAATMSRYVFSGIYQQSPTAAEGNFFRRPTFRYWRDMRPTADGRARVDLEGRPVALVDCWRFATVDVAGSTRTSADWTVISVWAVTPDGDLLLLDRARAQVATGDHFALAQPLRARWGWDVMYVEHGYFGSTLVSDARDAGWPVAEVRADTDKLTRAIPAAGRLHAGRVWFPAVTPPDPGGERPWLDCWCDELAAFPNGTHDDQVDTFSYAARVVTMEWAPPQAPPRRGLPAHSEVYQAAAVAATGHGDLDIMGVPY